MKKIAEWQDSRSKGIVYRLASNQECFVLEKRGEDSLGEQRWDEVKRFPRAGQHASDLTLLAIGLEEVQTQRRGRGLPEKFASVVGEEETEAVEPTEDGDVSPTPPKKFHSKKEMW